MLFRSEMRPVLELGYGRSKNSGLDSFHRAQDFGEALERQAAHSEAGDIITAELSGHQVPGAQGWTLQREAPHTRPGHQPVYRDCLAA